MRAGQLCSTYARCYSLRVAPVSRSPVAVVEESLGSSRRINLGLGVAFVVFFVSGFAALVYQVVWQRALLGVYGVNVESVAVVVTAFLLGLGVGSLVGGAVSKDPRHPPLFLFGLLELAIGVFGAVSLLLFRSVGEFTAGRSAIVTFVAAFCLVLVPTTAMGATLPLLTAYVVRRIRNVGRSVGLLYFVNTLGSAAAAAFASTYLLGKLGQQRSVLFAAVLNLGVGAVMLWADRNERRQA